MLVFEIDARSGVATYVQLVQQVRQGLRLGVLRPGEKLPAAREVVEALAINPNTVLKAYRELEREGLVVARQGLGTFVVETVSLPNVLGQVRLRRGLDRWLQQAHDAGLDAEDVEALYRAAVRESGFGSAGVA